MLLPHLTLTLVVLYVALVHLLPTAEVDGPVLLVMLVPLRMVCLPGVMACSHAADGDEKTLCQRS